MTIIAEEDTRGASTTTSSFGHKMLTKMGWSEGKGLGKNQHGQTNALRAVRREENLGIGATTDTHGGEGWSKTNTGFHGVLELLKMEHGSNSGSSTDKKKKKKKSKKKEEKRRNKKELRLAQNKVQAGHARKMRESKNISTKSKEDMAAIFGVRPEDIPTTAAVVVERPAEVTPIPSDVNSSDDDEENIVVEEKKSSSKKDKKQKKKKKDKKDKKRKRSSDDDVKNKKEKQESSSSEDDGKKKKKKRRTE